MSSSEIRPIDSLRGIFALLIVWHHLVGGLKIPYHCDFGSTIVIFFFILSGYGIALSWKGRIQEKDATKRFLVKRLTKIFPVQWFTVTLFVLFGINIYTYWAVPFHLTLTQSAMVPWYINFTMNVPSWFLSSLFFCYLATPLVLKYAVNHRKRYVILQVCAIMIWTLFLLLLPDTIGRRWLTYINPGARLLDYSIGLTLGLYWEDIKMSLANSVLGNRNKQWIYTLIETMFILFMFMFMTYSPVFKLDQYAVIRYPVIAGVVVIFSISKGRVSQYLQNKWLARLGGISMSIYMLHSFVLHWTKMPYIPVWLNVIIIYLIIIVFSYWVDKFLLQPCSKYCLKIANKMCNVN